MIDINILRENPELIRESVKRRNKDPKMVDLALELDTKWRKLTEQLEGLKVTQKKHAKDQNISEGKKIKEIVSKLEKENRELGEKRLKAIYAIPNILHKEVPQGKNDSENKVLREWGKKPEFSFAPKDHLELGKTLGIVDNERAAKVTGARFTYLKGGLAMMQLAILHWGISILTNEKLIKKIANKVEKGYSPKPFVPVFPPAMINPEAYTRMGRLTDEDKNERYHFEKDDLYLIGSAEHTLGPIYMDETLDEKDLPIRLVAYTTNFRREAGNYGKDTKGFFRMHQFDKLEMESFTLPENSKKEQLLMVTIQEYLMQKLNLPYRVVLNCSGDTGSPDARQYDIEAWIPSQNKYRETHSADLIEDYQARRLKTKIKTKNGKKVYAHMNDATALAMRTLIVIMENNQTKEGSIVVPKVLIPYVGLKKIE